MKYYPTFIPFDKTSFFINSFVKTNYYLASSIRENIAQTVLENDQHNGGQSI